MSVDANQASEIEAADGSAVKINPADQESWPDHDSHSILIPQQLLLIELAELSSTSYKERLSPKCPDQPLITAICKDATSVLQYSSDRAKEQLDLDFSQEHQGQQLWPPCLKEGSSNCQKLEICVNVCLAKETTPPGSPSSPATAKSTGNDHERAPRNQSAKDKRHEYSDGKDTRGDGSLLPGKIDDPDIDADMECRVCHVNLSIQSESCGDAMVLGCACRHGLAVAHRRCAEAWFKIKGNRICEICDVNAANIVGMKDVEFMTRLQEGDPSYQEQQLANAQYWWKRLPLCNLLISLIIAALILPWILHVNLFR